MQTQANVEELVIDGSGAILGRLASYVAKQLLSGKSVIIVNADKVAVSGNPTRLVQFYRSTVLSVKSHLSEKWRPKRARNPQLLVRKAVKGMLPKNDKGRETLSRLKVFVGVPKWLSNKAPQKLPDIMTVEKLTKSKYATLAEIARQLGWSG